MTHVYALILLFSPGLHGVGGGGISVGPLDESQCEKFIAEVAKTDDLGPRGVCASAEDTTRVLKQFGCTAADVSVHDDYTESSYICITDD